MAASAVVVLVTVARLVDVVGQLRRYHTLSGEAGVVTRHHHLQPATRQPPTRPRLRQAGQALDSPPPDASLSAASSAAAQQVSQLSMAEFLETIRRVVREERATTPQDSTGDGDTHAAPTSVPPPTSQSSLPPVAVSPSLPLTSTHLPAAQGSGGPAPTSGTFSPHQHILKGEGVMYSNSCSLHIGRCGS